MTSSSSSRGARSITPTQFLLCQAMSTFPKRVKKFTANNSIGLDLADLDRAVFTKCKSNWLQKGWNLLSYADTPHFRSAMSNYFAFLKKQHNGAKHTFSFQSCLIWSVDSLVRRSWLVLADLPAYEPYHPDDWLVYWAVGTLTAASKKNKNQFTIITPLIPHTGEHANTDAASSVKMCSVFDERSRMISRLTKNMRNKGSRNVLIGGCLWWWMGVILLEGQRCSGV